jgi:hypothetical protein
MAQPGTRPFSTLTPRRLAALAGIALLLAGALPAWANSAPSTTAWFLLAEGVGTLPPLAGAQLQFCLDDACARPDTALTFGQCTASACVAHPGPPPPFTRFGCDAWRCLYAVLGDNPAVRLVLQFEDGAYASPPLTDLAFGVSVFEARREAGGLALTQVEPTWRETHMARAGRWPAAFGLTLGVELVLATVLFGAGLAWQKQPNLLGQALLVTGLANLFTHPVVWFVFPMLAQWYDNAESGLPLGVGCLAVTYLGGLLGVYLGRGRWRQWLVLGASALFLLGCPLAAMLWFGGAYGGFAWQLEGWPPLAVLAAAEAFAVAAEAALIWLLTGRRVPLWLAGPASLLVNLASFAAGWWLTPAL